MRIDKYDHGRGGSHGDHGGDGDGDGGDGGDSGDGDNGMNCKYDFYKDCFRTASGDCTLLVLYFVVAVNCYITCLLVGQFALLLTNPLTLL